MKKYFSLRFYLDTLIRLRTLTIVFAVIFSAFAVVGNIGHLISLLTPSLAGGSEVLTRLDLFSVASGLSSFVCVAAPIMTVIAFSFLMKRSDSDFYEALPIRREAMLISVMLAVLSSMVFVIAVSSVVGVAVITPCIGKTVSYDFLRGFVEALCLLLCTVLAVLGSSVAISVTGTVRNAWLVAVTLLFVPRMILALINNSVMMLCPALVKGHVIPLFDNNYNLLTALFLGNDKVAFNPWAYLYTVIISAVYFIVALTLFKKRKSEFAAHSFTSKIARHMTAVLISVYVAMLGVYLVCIDTWLILISAFVFAFAIGIFFAYELITSRREKRSVTSALVAFTACIGAVVIAVATVFISSFVLGSYSPDAEDIESVSLSPELAEDTFGFLTYEQYVTLRCENVKLDDELSRNIVAKALERGYDGTNSRDYISVALKIDTGFVTYRRVSLTPEEHLALSSLFAENTAYKDLWMKVSDGAIAPTIHGSVDITGEGAERVLGVMEAEIAEIGFDEWFSIYYGSYNEYAANINFEAIYGNDVYMVSLGIYEQMPKTYSVYLEELQMAAENTYDEILESLTDAASGEGEELNLYATLYTEFDGYYIETVISDGTASEGLVSELFALVEPTAYGNESAYSISISVYGDGINSKSLYAEFSVSAQSIDELRELFKKYGTE